MLQFYQGDQIGGFLSIGLLWEDYWNFFSGEEEGQSKSNIFGYFWEGLFYINTFTHLHIYTFTHLHIYTFTHLHIYNTNAASKQVLSQIF